MRTFELQKTTYEDRHICLNLFEHYLSDWAQYDGFGVNKQGRYTDDDNRTEAGMHKINTQLRAITDMVWSIKRCELEIGFKDLIDFYKEYQFHRNLVVDAINAQVIQHDGANMPFSEEEIAYFIDALTLYNKYDYDRLVCEALFALNDAQAYQYLSKILDTDEKRASFRDDFQNWTHFEQAREELRKIGNII